MKAQFFAHIDHIELNRNLLSDFMKMHIVCEGEAVEKFNKMSDFMKENKSPFVMITVESLQKPGLDMTPVKT